MHPGSCNKVNKDTMDGRNPAQSGMPFVPVFIRFIHPNWCRNWSIHSRTSRTWRGRCETAQSRKQKATSSTFGVSKFEMHPPAEKNAASGYELTKCFPRCGLGLRMAIIRWIRYMQWLSDRMLKETLLRRWYLRVPTSW